MSFSSDVKTELCKQPITDKCCAAAECFGVLLYGNTFSNSGIKIITESRPFAKRLTKLFKAAFGFTEEPQQESEGGKIIFTVTDPARLDAVFNAYGYDRGTALAHHINFGVLEDECCRRSFVRGAFLAGGSVTDPEKRYHLEFVTDHYSVSREACSIMQELGFEPKITDRSGRYIIYYKQSAAIEDMLTTMGAPVSAMNFMNAKITKNMMNSVNRKVNCDTANVSRTVEASQQQLDAIRKLEATGKLTALPEKLRETARLRLEYPELSLRELAELTDPIVTKSCLNHRLRKLVEIAGN